MEVEWTYGNFIRSRQSIRAFKCEEMSLRFNYEECAVLSYVRVTVNCASC